MQMYPRENAYKEQRYYEEVSEEYIVDEDVKGSAMHMMTTPHGQFNHGQTHGQHHDYGNHGQSHGHADQFKNKYGQHGYGGQIKHNYGGYDDGHKNGVERCPTQYGESWRDDAWKNDYSAHGGKHGYGHNGGHDYSGHGGNGYGHNGVKHNMYGGHEGHYGPHKESQYKYSEEIRVPVWKFKGISE